MKKDYQDILFKMFRSGYLLKLHFQVPCVFPVRRQIFPVQIYMICDYYLEDPLGLMLLHTKN